MGCLVTCMPPHSQCCMVVQPWSIQNNVFCLTAAQTWIYTICMTFVCFECAREFFSVRQGSECTWQPLCAMGSMDCSTTSGPFWKSRRPIHPTRGILGSTSKPSSFCSAALHLAFPAPISVGFTRLFDILCTCDTYHTHATHYSADDLLMDGGCVQLA